MQLDRALLEHADPARVASTVTHVVQTLSTGRVVVISTTDLPEVPVAGALIASRLASIVADVCDRVRVGGLVLTGGDTAAAVCRALGAAHLWLTGELQPGMATAMLLDGSHPGLPVVTKAGGFGDEAALTLAAASMRSCGPAPGPRRAKTGGS